jgi:hypothetical protein
VQSTKTLGGVQGVHIIWVGGGFRMHSMSGDVVVVVTRSADPWANANLAVPPDQPTITFNPHGFTNGVDMHGISLHPLS